MREKWINEVYERLWTNNESFTSQSENLLLLSGLENDHPVIVRSEYISIWDYIEKTKANYNPRGCGGLVVVGQPGAGSTLFLDFILFISLSKKIPVVYCNVPDTCFVFNGNGCIKLSLHNTLSDDLPKNPLVLVDSSPDLMSPPALFASDRFRGFVVQATSPDRSRWSGWSRQRGTDFWVMPLWTRTEILSLQQFIESNSQNCAWLQGDYYSPEELFDILGPSPRACFARVRPKSSEGLLADFGDYSPQELDFDLDGFVNGLLTGYMPSAHRGNTFHDFFYVSDPESSNPAFAPNLSYAVPTPFLRSLLYDKFRDLTVPDQAALARKLSLFPQVAWTFYELKVIDILRFAAPPLSFHICHPYKQTLQIGAGLHAAPIMVLPTDHSKTRFTEHNRIHILPTEFAPLSAFVICEGRKRVISLRIATTQDPDLKPEAIMKVVKLFPETERESMQWIFLFVGPKKFNEALTQKPDKSVNVDGVEIDVCVGWSAVSTIDEFTSNVLNELLRGVNSGRRV